ncbi:MAG: 4Fe-4S dicluster domain-containing protein [Clostridia bacterium]|nr:4Fe-4S dicluster domain-containing protein [Clostridia bacterium]NLS84060.1 4Fe-4S dicluster domain-containing protein [Oscillospiraceae bacterium]
MAQTYFHSVTLDKDLCMGCINCIKRCPTQAIRVRDGKADIMAERCIDCAECIRICPHHAKKAIYDPLEILDNFKYKIALPPPSLYGQFNNMDETDIVLNGLLKMGFDDVFEVARAAEYVSDATRRILQTESIDRPVISSACPAVAKLIRVRFPQLIDHVLPLNAPIEYAAHMAKDEAVEKTGLKREEIGCIFITPCPAKVTAIHAPIGIEKSEVDAAIAVKDVYPKLISAMKHTETMDYLASAGRIGLGWAESGGEAAGLVSTDNYLAADGIENVIRVLEDLEDEKYGQLDFVELNACSGGCVGGVLQVENPYIAKAKLKRLRRYIPVSKNHLTGSVPAKMLWNKDLTYNPAFELGGTQRERFEKYSQMEKITAELPGLDCGSCGAPTCSALAEDIVRGLAKRGDCTVLMRRRMEGVLKALGKETENDD